MKRYPKKKARQNALQNAVTLVRIAGKPMKVVRRIGIGMFGTDHYCKAIPIVEVVER